MIFAIFLLLLFTSNVFADSPAFKTELAELVENAIKATKSGKVNISPQHSTETAQNTK